MVVALTIRATRRSAFSRRTRGEEDGGAGSTVCGPEGSHTVSASRIGQGRLSTIAPPCHGIPTPLIESITVFGPSLSILVTAAAADGSIFRSGGIREFSKYNATREK